MLGPIGNSFAAIIDLPHTNPASVIKSFYGNPFLYYSNLSAILEGSLYPRVKFEPRGVERR
jgi:hypothetical protein